MGSWNEAWIWFDAAITSLPFQGLSPVAPYGQEGEINEGRDHAMQVDVLTSQSLHTLYAWFGGQRSTLPCSLKSWGPLSKGPPYLSSVPFAAHASGPFHGLQNALLGPAPICSSLHLHVAPSVSWGSQGPRVSVAPSCSSLVPYTMAPSYPAEDCYSYKPPCSEISRIVVAKSPWPTHLRKHVLGSPKTVLPCSVQSGPEGSGTQCTYVGEKMQVTPSSCPQPYDCFP